MPCYKDAELPFVFCGLPGLLAPSLPEHAGIAGTNNACVEFLVWDRHFFESKESTCKSGLPSQSSPINDGG
jgi:hypothetical protein